MTVERAVPPPFDRHHRLRSRRDFQVTYDQGVKLVNRQLVVWIVPRPEGPSRLGLSVSRRVGGAVTRNRVKRCLREAWRRVSPALGAPVDLIALARPAHPPLDAAAAEQALAHLLRQWARRQKGTGSP